MVDASPTSGDHVAPSISLLKKSPSADHANGVLESNGFENGVSQPRAVSLSDYDKQLIRVIGQYLNDVGLSQSASTLIQESQCVLENSAASRFRNHVMNGDWREAEKCLDELKDNLNRLEDVKNVKFLLYEQKYLELVDEQKLIEAVLCLRKDLNPHKNRQKRIHFLASLVMYGRDEMRRVSRWPGKGEESRIQLMEKFNSLLPVDVMLPKGRLMKLLDQSLQMQTLNCTYHNLSNIDLDPINGMNSSREASTVAPLLTDHKCSKRDFPCKLKQTVMEHYEKVLYCRFNHAGTYLGACVADGRLAIYSVTSEYTLKPSRTFLHDYPVSFLAWSPNDRYIVCCGQHSASTVTVWNMEQMELAFRLNNSAEESLTCAVWLPDSTKFACAGIQGQFYLCDVSGNIETSWEGIRVVALACSPHEPVVYAADTHCRVRAYRQESDSSLIQADSSILSLEVSRCGQFLLLTMAQGGGLQLYHLPSTTLLMRYAGMHQHKDYIFSSFGGLNQSFVASGSEDKNVYIWHRDKSMPIAVLVGHTEQVNSVSWNPAVAQMLVSASDDTTLKVWGPPCYPPAAATAASPETDSDSDTVTNDSSGGGDSSRGGALWL